MGSERKHNKEIPGYWRNPLMVEGKIFQEHIWIFWKTW